jgi:hypothetical protein
MGGLEVVFAVDDESDDDHEHADHDDDEPA